MFGFECVHFVVVVVMTHLYGCTHPSIPCFQQSIKHTSLRSRQAAAALNMGRVLSRHAVVLFRRRNVMTREICHAEPEFESLPNFFNEWKIIAES